MSTNGQSTVAQQAKRHQRALNIIKRWRLMDDDFMKRCFKDNIPAVECILRIIMEKPDLQVETVQIEDTIPNLSGHGIRMDVHATDSTGTEYDIEVQRADKGAGTKRARFNSSLLDLNSLRKGSDYEKTAGKLRHLYYRKRCLAAWLGPLPCQPNHRRIGSTV